MVPSRFLICVFALSIVSSAALSDIEQGTAVRADPQRVAQLYAGKTDLWGGDCGGGIYLSPDMQARAWCKASSEAFGAGSWSIDRAGRLCHSLRWYWPDGEATGAGTQETSCIEHVEDSRGRIWRRWPGDPKWWRMTNPQKPVKGFKYRRNVAQARDAAGL